MIFYFKVLTFKKDMRPVLQVVWYGVDINCLDLCYDLENSEISLDDCTIHYAV